MGLAYERLLERCDVQDWDVGLSFGKRGWVLSVRDNGGELIARARSSMRPPEVYDRLAISAVVSLERQR